MDFHDFFDLYSFIGGFKIKKKNFIKIKNLIKFRYF